MYRAKDALINHNKVRITRANHPFRVDKAIHVNRDPAGVHEDEAGVPDQPEMIRPKSLDEELLPERRYFNVGNCPSALTAHRRP